MDKFPKSGGDELNMNIIRYVKENGVGHCLSVLYRYKLDALFTRLLGLFLCRRPLRDIIVIESHNDFDSNGGAFYRYLLQNGYDRRYRIVWLLKHKRPKRLPPNVTAVPLCRPSLRKAYYRWIARFFTVDCSAPGKLRSNQVCVYFGHGGFGLKDCRGHMDLPDGIDRVLMQSHGVDAIFAGQFGLAPDDKRLCYVGFPYLDTLVDGEPGDLHKIIGEERRKGKKTLLWMPTFRKGGFHREDGTVGPLGVPLIPDQKTWMQLDKQLNELGLLLILKIHPMQDLRDLKVTETPNIRILTGVSVKTLGVDNYRLMKDCDAMLSDYSSAAYDFLYLDRPIAYDLSDLSDYRIGLCVDDPQNYMAGPVIRGMEDLYAFLSDLAAGRDRFAEARQALRRKLFDYTDADNCRRAADLLGLAAH